MHRLAARAGCHQHQQQVLGSHAALVLVLLTGFLLTRLAQKSCCEGLGGRLMGALALGKAVLPAAFLV